MGIETNLTFQILCNNYRSGEGSVTITQKCHKLYNIKEKASVTIFLVSHLQNYTNSVNQAKQHDDISLVLNLSEL